MIRRRRRKKAKPKNMDCLPDWLIGCLKSLKPPERLTVSQWADKNRILDEKTSAQPGTWRTSTTPYLEEIMNSFTDPEIEETVFVKATQVGGTEVINNITGYIIEQDPSPSLVVYPMLDLAEFTSKNRIQPMVDLAPTLKERYHTRESKDLELQFDGMYIVLAGANSPASLSSRPIRYLLLDEIDKYPPSSGKEADPISLARERLKTYTYNKKVFMTSTPTYKNGNIWRAMNAADEIRRYQVPCPFCGHFQEFKFKQLKWPEGIDKIEVMDVAWYECEKCGERITDVHKMNMIRNGHWTTERKGSRSRVVAFHLNTFYSPWIRFGEIAYEFLKSKDFPDQLKNFVNSWLAEPWEETRAKMSSELVFERQSEYEEGQVPDEALVLTGGVDVQRNKVYWTIRAWGPYFTSWNIAHGESATFEDMVFIMNQAYKKSNGDQYQVSLCCIDSGDRTEDVYDICAENEDWLKPVKGSSARMMMNNFKISSIDKANSKANGLQLIIVNTKNYKDMISAKMNRQNGNGSWMVYKGCDLEYATQVTSEHKVIEKKGSSEVEVWQPKMSGAANHFFDTEVYAAVAGDLLGARYLSEEIIEEVEVKAPASESNPFIKNGDWFKRGGM